GDDGDFLVAEFFQRIDQGTGRAQHRNFHAVVFYSVLQTLLRHAVVAVALGHDGNQASVGHHAHAGVAQLNSAAIAGDVHGFQLFGVYVHHAHARGVEGEALFRKLGVTSLQHGRNLGFHGGVGAGNDLTDAVGFHRNLSLKVVFRLTPSF